MTLQQTHKYMKAPHADVHIKNANCMLNKYITAMTMARSHMHVVMAAQRILWGPLGPYICVDMQGHARRQRKAIITHMENPQNMTIICTLPQLEFELKGMGNS